MKVFVERIEKDGNLYDVYKDGKHIEEHYVPTQEELNAQRIEEIKVELRQIKQDIEDYNLLGDTVIVDELNVQRQALIDEYSALKVTE